jgi:histone acetyltransferase (RNA polymerase elongator complex component)
MISLLDAAYPFIKEYSLHGIRISTRPDKIDGEVLDVLSRYNVTSIELGAQSMCDDVLMANDRGHTSEDVVKASKMIKDAGFELGLQMMTGLYLSTPERDRYTAEKIISLSPATVRIYPTVILEGTKLAELYKKGEYKTIPFEEEAELCADIISMFEKAGIRIIRLGLHASENVGNDAVGGYYHPAFGEICRSILFRREAEKRITEKGNYELYVSPKSASIANGQKRSNIEYFAEKGINIKVRQDNDISDEKQMRIVKI